MEKLTHFNAAGRPRMVDVSDKQETVRVATAAARVLVNRDTFQRIQDGGVQKGDVLAAAQIAGIQGAKHTWELIPMCHPVQLTGVDLEFRLDASAPAVEILATARCTGPTGVEMEALAAVSTAALTVYDMCKSIQQDMVIDGIRLLYKSGGRHGEYIRKE